MSQFKIPFYRSITFRFIVSVCTLLTLGIMLDASLAAKKSYERLYAQTQDQSLSNARESASAIEAIINTWSSQVNLIASNLGGKTEKELEDIIKRLISSDKQTAAAFVVKKTRSKLKKLAFVNNIDPKDPRFLSAKLNERTRNELDSNIQVASKARIKPSKELETEIFSLGIASKLPLLAMASPFPTEKSNESIWVVTVYWQNTLAASLPSNPVLNSKLFLNDGELVVSPDPADVAKLESITPPPQLKGLIASNVPYGQKTQESGLWVANFMSFAKLKSKPLVVVTALDGTHALSLIKKELKVAGLMSILLLLIVMAISVLLSNRLTSGVLRLTRSTLAIAQGDFRPQVEVKSRDEIGLLGHSINYMATQIAQSLDAKIEVARLEGEMATAKLVQDSFIAPDVERGPLRISTFYSPASECGGDWWGHYRFDDRYHLVCIADATGHGLSAALITAMTFAITTVIASFKTTPKSLDGFTKFLLDELNRTLTSITTGKFTMTYYAILFDFETGVATYSNASHNFPFLIPLKEDDDRLGKIGRRKKRVTPIPKSEGPIGVDNTTRYQERKLTFAPGDKIFLYTDGIFECANIDGNQLGSSKFRRYVNKRADMDGPEFNQSIVVAAQEFIGDNPQDDDITALTVEISKRWRPGFYNPNEDFFDSAEKPVHERGTMEIPAASSIVAMNPPVDPVSEPTPEPALEPLIASNTLDSESAPIEVPEALDGALSYHQEPVEHVPSAESQDPLSHPVAHEQSAEVEEESSKVSDVATDPHEEVQVDAFGKIEDSMIDGMSSVKVEEVLDDPSEEDTENKTYDELEDAG